MYQKVERERKEGKSKREKHKNLDLLSQLTMAYLNQQ